MREQARERGITVEIDQALSQALERLISRAEKELAGAGQVQASAADAPGRETSTVEVPETAPMISDVPATHGYA